MKNLVEKIENFKQDSYFQDMHEDGNFVFAPLKHEKFEDVKYGFVVFSKEKYELALDKLNDCQYKHRYYYYEQFGSNKDKEIIFVMFNPSSACPDKDDPTIKNCRKLAIKNNYSGMEVINIFSERNPEVKAIDTENNTDNFNFIKELLSKRENADVVLAWGYGKNKEYSDKINKIEKLLENHNKFKIVINEEALSEIKNQDRHPAPTAWGLFGGFDDVAELSKINEPNRSA